MNRIIRAPLTSVEFTYIVARVGSSWKLLTSIPLIERAQFLHSSVVGGVSSLGWEKAALTIQCVNIFFPWGNTYE